MKNNFNFVIGLDVGYKLTLRKKLTGSTFLTIATTPSTLYQTPNLRLLNLSVFILNRLNVEIK